MTIPSQKLPDVLEPGVYILRSSAFELLNPQLQYTEAVAMAYCGEIEGIATQTGRLKYLRMLAKEERPDAMDRAEVSLDDQGRSTAFCNPNIGVYEQALGNPVTCYTYAHCGCRAFDGAR